LQATIWGKLSDKCGDDETGGIAVKISAHLSQVTTAMWRFAIVAMERGVFWLRPAAGTCRIVPADPTKPLLPNPNSASSESVSVGICRIANGAATRLWAPFTVSKAIRWPGTTDRIFVT